MVVDQAKQFESIDVTAPNRLVIRFKPGYAVFKTACERPEQVARFEQALAEVAGQRLRVEFALAAEPAAGQEPAVAPARVVSPINGGWRRCKIRWFIGPPNCSAPR